MPTNKSKNTKTEHISDDEYEEDINEVEESASENEEDNDTTTENDIKKKKKVIGSDAIFAELILKFNSLEQAEAEFIEKEKEFKKSQSEFNTLRKKTMREMSTIISKVEKSIAHDMSKKKPRKTENAGKGGFNKEVEVPEILRTFIGIDKDDLKSRPQVTKLLNAKFSEANLIKTNKDDEGKEYKVIILDKSNAKKLKQKEGEEIRCKEIQSFIAKFYKDEKSISA
jgi:hypothetical protein